MTAAKQVSVCSERHLRNIRSYLDWNREKVLAHDTQNIIDEGRWFEEMRTTREQLHHNEPGKAARAAHTCSMSPSTSIPTSAVATAAR